MSATDPASALLAQARRLLADLPSAEAILIHRRMAEYHTTEGLRMVDERRRRLAEAGELKQVARAIRRLEATR